jgi:hypothetical protein
MGIRAKVPAAGLTDLTEQGFPMPERIVDIAEYRERKNAAARSAPSMPSTDRAYGQTVFWPYFCVPVWFVVPMAMPAAGGGMDRA